MTRRLAALGCALLLLTAGCAGIGGQNDQPTDVATNGTTTTTTTTGTPEQLAPGVTTAGVQDADLLGGAHFDALRTHSFVKHERFERTNGSQTASMNRTLRHANASNWRRTITSDGLPIVPGEDNGTRIQYADGERVLEQYDVGDGPEYNAWIVSDENGTHTPPPSDALLGGLALAPAYERELVTTLAGHADGVERREGGGAVVSGTAPELSDLAEPAADVEFTLRVTGDGLVEAIDLSYDHEADDENATYERSVRFERQESVRVERPDWYATAMVEVRLAAFTEGDPLAPGVTADGVQNARLLADAHLATVENETFVTRDRVRRTNASGTGTRNATLAMTNESHWQYGVTGDGMRAMSVFGAEAFDTYADGERMLWRAENESAVQYDVYTFEGENGTVVVPPDEVFAGSYSNLYGRSLVHTLAGNADSVEVFDNGTGPLDDGDTAVELSGSADELTLGTRKVTDAEFTMAVASRGQAQSIELSYESEDATVERTVAFDTNVTDPVEEPAWYETALNETGVAGSGSADTDA